MRHMRHRLRATNLLGTFDTPAVTVYTPAQPGTPRRYTKGIRMANIADLLADKRRVRDELDTVNQKLATLREADTALDRQIMDAMTEAGLTEAGAKVSGSGMTVTRTNKWRAIYKPEKWADFFKWCAVNNYDYLIHRRMSDAKIMELVDAGVALPDGVTVESFPELNCRRV